jgi:quinol monooxygenase YgiN
MSIKEEAMHIQIVNFNLREMSDEDFRTLCDQLAPVFADLPGMISKVWLADPATNTYGGVYTWQNRQAMEAFTQSELFQNVANHPNFTNITARDFEILDGPTRVTHGLAQALAN